MPLGNGLTTLVVGAGLWFLGAPVIVLGMCTGCVALLDIAGYVDEKDLMNDGQKEACVRWTAGFNAARRDMNDRTRKL
jgi:hypothetical protein